MMNNEDLHLNKFSEQIDVPGQSLNNSNQDICYELLKKLSADDDTSNNTANLNLNNVDNKDDKFKQEIMSALEKKDLNRIMALTISQCNGHNMSLLTETFQEIQMSSNKHVDPKIVDKLCSLVQPQPKTMATTPLRATVAPIRNESIVSSSSSNMSSSTGFRSNKTIKTELGSDDFMSLISTDCKPLSGTRSLPATPPIVQVPNRPPSSHCVPIRSSNDQRKQRAECEIEAQQHQLAPFYQYGTSPAAQAPMQYLPLNMSQFAAQYPSSLMAPNIVIMPMMSSPDQPPVVTHAPIMSQAGGGQPGLPAPGQQNNQISVLLSSAAFFSMANTAPSQTVTTSHDSAGPLAVAAAGSRPVPGTATHASNLPKLLPKPQQPVIMPRTMQFASAVQHQVHPTASPLTHQHQTTGAIMASQQQPFKRPSTRKSSVKPRSGSGSSRSSRANKKGDMCSKDNVAVAWEIASEDLSSSFLNDPTAGTISDDLSASFINDLNSGTTDNFCLTQSVGEHNFYTTTTAGDQQSMEIDDFIHDLNAMCWDERHAPVHTEEIDWQTCSSRIDATRYWRANIVCNDDCAGTLAVSRRPLPSRKSVSVVRQSPIAELMPCAPPSVNASNLESQRVMQLFCAHFGRPAATLLMRNDLSPLLLKCLLPPSADQAPTASAGPLSVCTRLSEPDDLLTEDDLLADISPVKRDPRDLAKLDRILESCQSISPHCSSMQDYDEPMMMFDDAKQLLPFQPDCDDDMPLTLHDFCSQRSPDEPACWLRKGGKQRNKWSLNGTIVRCSKALELPSPIAVSSSIDDGLGGDRFLRKKSAFNKIRISSSKLHRPSLRMRNHEDRKPSSPPDSELADPVDQPDDLADGDIAGPIDDDAASACSDSGNLKMRIKLDSMRVVWTTVARPPAEPDGPLQLDEVAQPVFLAPSPDPPSPLPTPSPLPLPPAPIVTKSPHKRSKPKSITVAPLLPRQVKKHTESNTKRIFCTRKEDRRSSALNTSISPTKPVRKSSPSKIKRAKCASVDHPPLILKLCAKKPPEPTATVPFPSVPIEPVRPPPVATTGSLKLRLKRAAQDNQAFSTLSAPVANVVTESVVMKTGYEFSPPVNLAPPVTHRPRPQLAALQFSPAHSSSDSDVDVAHNEINSLLQRQEQRDPISSATGDSSAPVDCSSGGHHHQSSFPSLPVPYLVGSDPTVFIDPHEFDLVVVKNSKYKKMSQRDPPVDIGQHGVVDVVSDAIGNSNNNELFVPGCFVEQDKSHIAQSWNHSSSPSMPVLAPQEPFTGSAVDNKSSSHIAIAYDYGNQSQLIGAPNHGSYSTDASDRLQQSPLCMTSTSSNNPSHQSSQPDRRQDPIKSPPYHHSSYYQQQSYNGPCYLNDNIVASNPDHSRSSKPGQTRSSPAAALQTSSCSSHMSDYSLYFHNSSQLGQSLLPSSSDSASFSSISLSSSAAAYQASIGGDHQSSSKHSKRSSSTRSHSDQSSSKKQRKEPQPPQPPPLQLPQMYTSNADIYNAAAQYQNNFDYYPNGFSEIMSSIDRAKIYEHWSNITPLCPSNLPWMAEYCKQAANLNTAASGFGLPSSNPLSLTSSSLHHATSAADYSSAADISQSDPLKPSLPYLDSYTAYAMAQPYIYPPFGMPK